MDKVEIRQRSYTKKGFDFIFNLEDGIENFCLNKIKQWRKPSMISQYVAATKICSNGHHETFTLLKNNNIIKQIYT